MVRASTLFLAVGLAVVCLAPLSSATYGYGYSNNLGWCLNGCRSRGWWPWSFSRSWQRSCLCRTNCIRSYLLRNQDPQNPTITECIYQRLCAHYKCIGYYYKLKLCKLGCIADYYNRKKPTPAPSSTVQPATATTPQPTTTYIVVNIEVTTTPPGIIEMTTMPPGIEVTPMLPEVTATAPVIEVTTTLPVVEITATPFPVTTFAMTEEATATEATTTIEMTTTEMTTTEMMTTTEGTTTEATTTEGTTTEAMTTTDQPPAGIMS